MVFDAHSDIWSHITIHSLLGERNILKNYHLEPLNRGKIEGGIFAIWIDPPFDKSPMKRTKQIMAAIDQEIMDCKEVEIVKNYTEMMAAKIEGKFYIFIGLEGISSIGDNLNLLDAYYDFGARHVMLTWNEENHLATGAKGNPKRGLTALGKKAVEKIVAKNMLLDVSHLNEKSFWDVAGCVETPLIASHSNAKALCDATRNLTDEQLLRIRDSGGVVGINSYHGFIGEKPENQTVDMLVKHLVYLVEKMGIDHVGFGFDFLDFLEEDEAAIYPQKETFCTKGLETCTKVPILLQKMEQLGFSKEEMNAISYGNFHRVIKEVLK